MKQDSVIAAIQTASKELAQQLEIMHHALPHKLSTSQRCALVELDTYKLMSFGQLTAALRLEKSTVSRLVAPLVQQGFCIIQTNQDDLRNKFISLTPQGNELVKQINFACYDNMQNALASLDIQEKNHIAQVLSHYTQLLKNFNLKKICTIRKISKKDMDAIPYFFRRVQKEHHLNDDHPIALFLKKRARERTFLYSRPRSSFFAVVCGEKIVGIIGYKQLSDDHPEICLVGPFYLSPQIRRLGIGTSLMKKILLSAQKDGYKYCYRELFDPVQNPGKFYEKLGFKELDKPLVTPDKPIANRWYIKEL